MYLSEYLDRKETAESVFEPRYIEKELTLDGAIAFLSEYKGLPYPRSWFLSKPERTISIYKKAYVEYWKQFMIEFREYDNAKRELKYLESVKEQNLIVNDLEVAYQYQEYRY